MLQAGTDGIPTLLPELQPQPPQEKGKGRLPLFSLEAIPLLDCPHPLCAWCWYHVHPEVPFPEQESSTICTKHAEWMYQQYRRRKEPQS